MLGRDEQNYYVGRQSSLPSRTMDKSSCFSCFLGPPATERLLRRGSDQAHCFYYSETSEGSDRFIMKRSLYLPGQISFSSKTRA
jgi:hypothetical protein